MTTMKGMDWMNRLTVSLAVMIPLASPAAAQSLTGAGATWPTPIYTKWFDAYH